MKPSLWTDHLRRYRPTMPHLDRLAPDRLYFTDAAGVRWRVYDVGFGPPHAPPHRHRVYELGSPRATNRWFIGEDGSRRIWQFGRGESRELTEELVGKQLAAAGYAMRSTHEPVTRPW